MSGFAVLIAPGSAHQEIEDDFQNLLRFTANYKELDIPLAKAAGSHCIAAKLDSPATIHHGIFFDLQTGSWILAAGTVIAIYGDNDPSTILMNLLHAYLQNGEKALDQYDGHFALIIYDGQEESISVVSDPIGLFSIFYSQQGGKFFVSTSALAVALQIHSEPDVLAIEHFLRTGRLDANKTLWQGVKRLFAASVLKITQTRVDEKEYWSPTFDKSVSGMSLDEALDQSSELLAHTFSRTLQREGKVWADLTGGFDSRLAAAQMANLTIPFITYCMGPEDHPDVQLSRKISQEMKWEYVHTQLPELWGADQYSWFGTALGLGDGRVSLLRLAVTLRGFEERNATIKTNVMGVGGENWRGYLWQIEKGNIGRTTTLNYAALLDNLFSPAIPLRIMLYDRTKEVRQEISDFIHQLCSKYSELPNSVQIDRFEICRDAGHAGAYLSAIASSERSLAPFCFKALVNFGFSLNYHWKYPRHHLFVRKLLERENKRLANVDTTTGGPAVPIRLTNAHRFWPLWKDITNRAVAIGSKKILGKTLQVWPQSEQSGYPLPAWRTAFLSYARSEGLLSYDTMCTSGLYNRNEFDAYIEQAGFGQHNRSEFLDRVISVEMAMRAVGSSIV